MSRRSVRLQEKTAASKEVTGVAGNSSIVPTSKTKLRRVGEKTQRHQQSEYENNDRDRPPRKRALVSKMPSHDTNDVDLSDSAPKKKQRMAEEFRKVRGRLGLLERLAKDIPLDVIFEIFCYLDPGDLLHLAWTSKDLRGILMSKSSEAIWRSARANVQDLPPRPDDLNEPQYARLLFDPHCYVCSHKGHCENVLWTFRARVCKKCVIDVLPLYDEYYLKQQPQEYRNSGILPNERVLVGRSFLCVASNKWTKRYRTEFEALQTADECKNWICRKQKELHVIQKHGISCQVWHEKRLNQRSNDLRNIRITRKKDIYARLEEIGLSEEAEHLETRRMHEPRYDEYIKILYRTKKLTEQGWISIKGELVELLSAHRETRLEAERTRIIRERYDQLLQAYRQIFSKSDLRQPFPAVGDIFINKIFENLIWDTPTEETQMIDFETKLAEHLPGLIEKWRPTKIRELLNLIQKAKSNSKPKVSDFHLATTIFECTACYTVMHYPQMFYHSCCFQNQAPDQTSHERLLKLSTFYYQSYSCLRLPWDSYGPWSSRKLVLNTSLGVLMGRILEGFSLDPNTATLQELQSASLPIECVNCTSDKGHVFLWWPSVLTHRHHYELQFRKTSKEVAEDFCSDSLRPVYEPICCVHCHEQIRVADLREHLQELHKDNVIVRPPTSQNTHDIKDIEEHWYFDPRVPMQSLYKPFFFPKTESLSLIDI